MAGNGGFHVATHVGNSNIDGAGRGRFSDETIKAGSIIRTQSFGGEFLAVYENLEELVPNISNQEQTSLVDTRVVESPVYTTPTHLAHFGCSIPNDQPDARYTTAVFVNRPPMYTNHSSTPNIKYKYDYNAKVKTTLAARDIARGDELLQDYGSFSKVEWFTEYIKESTNGLSSVIEFDGSF